MNLFRSLRKQPPAPTTDEQARKNLEYMDGVVSGALAAIRLAHSVLEAAAHGEYYDRATAEEQRLLAVEAMGHLTTLQGQLRKALLEVGSEARPAAAEDTTKS